MSIFIHIYMFYSKQISNVCMCVCVCVCVNHPNMRTHIHTAINRGCPCGVMVKTMDYGIVVSEFELQSCYYVHFQANTLEKGYLPEIV